tara:strand:+ start:469 stop:2115 length:1647 start_codon:yes stop_codon:yes gene_type:complete
MFAMVAFDEQFEDFSVGPYFWSLSLLLYNLPGLPVQLLQGIEERWMVRYIRDYGHTVLFYFRSTVTAIPLAFLLCIVPFAQSNSHLHPLLSFVALLLFAFITGVLQAASFGWVLQLSSCFPRSHGYCASEASLAGMGAATLLLLTVTLTEHYNASSSTSAETFFYFGTCASLLLLGYACNILLLSLPFVKKLMLEQDKVVLRRQLRLYLLEAESELSGSAKDQEFWRSLEKAGTNQDTEEKRKRKELPSTLNELDSDGEEFPIESVITDSIEESPEAVLLSSEKWTGPAREVELKEIRSGSDVDDKPGANITVKMPSSCTCGVLDQGCGSSANENSNQEAFTQQPCCSGSAVCLCKSNSIAHALTLSRSLREIRFDIIPSIFASAMSALSLVIVSAIIPRMEFASSTVLISSDTSEGYDEIGDEVYTTTMMFAQSVSLFFGNLVSTQEGTLANHPNLVLGCVTARLFLFFFLLLYTFNLGWVMVEWLGVLVISIHAATGSFLNSVSYQLASKSVPPQEGTVAVKQLNIVLYLCYSIGAILSLTIPLFN